jgi:hypothetical protein
LDYVRQGWHRDRIAALFLLSSRDIQAAVDYIEQHQEEVATYYQTILDRQTQYPYPPEVTTKIAASRQRAQARLAAERQPQGEQYGRVSRLRSNPLSAWVFRIARPTVSCGSCANSVRFS